MTSRSLRGLRAALTLDLRADRAHALACMVLFIIRPLTLVVSAEAVKIIVDAATHHHRTLAVLTGCLIAVVNVAGFTAGFYGIRLAHTVMGKAAHLLDRELIGLALAPAGIAHQENRDYLDRLDAMSADRTALSEAADVVALLLGAGLRAFLTAVLLALVSPWLLVIPLLAVPSVLAASRSEEIRQRALKRAAGPLRQARHIFELASASESGKELRIYGLQQGLRDRHSTLQLAGNRQLDGAASRAFAATAIGWTIFAAGYALALLLVARQAVGGSASLGSVVLTFTLLTSINMQLTQTMRFTQLTRRCAAAGTHLSWLRSYAGSSSGIPGRAEHQVSQPPAELPDVLSRGISLRGVAFTHAGRGEPSLSDVNLDLPAGSVVYLVGENGAGKTTLVKLLTKLYEPAAGAITVDGIELKQVDADQWRARVTGVFQDFARLEFLLRETVGLGDLANLDNDVAVISAIKNAGALDVVEELPQKIETPLGHSHDQGRELSGGQWQKLALARGMMRNGPLLMVLDEPTSAIDAETERMLLDQHAAAARTVGALTGAVTILVSHRFGGMRSADLIVVLDKGRVAEVGTHAELMTADGLYADLYDLNASAFL